MFVYLNKKIAIPHDSLLTTLSWSKSKGFIACGGEKGLLKVLKLEPQNEGNVRGIAAPTPLTMNETLKEHESNITKIVWNEKFDKMTTADESGVIIVWMLFKNQWHQEMKNGSNKSRVNGMKWNSDGEKICIAYQDGGIILGSVDGSRLWGKTVDTHLNHVEWSPDSRLLLFGLENGDVHIYDCGGNKLGKLENYCVSEDAETNNLTIVAIEWYNGEKGYIKKDCPCLAICYSNGCCQIMKNENDTNPVLIKTGIDPRSIAWNADGTIISIAGIQENSGKETNLVQFYDCFGFHLRTLKIPAKPLRACSWDGESLRIAIAVDTSVYFASIRPNYMWAYCPGVIIFGKLRPYKCNHTVTFWNIKSEMRYTKTYGKLKSIISSGNLCCIIYQNESESNKFILQLCNSIGTAIDSIEIPFEPIFFSMVQSHVIVASSCLIYLWQFKKPENLLAIESQMKKQRASIFRHIDNESKLPETLPDISTSQNGFSTDLNNQLKKLNNQKSMDPICCICTSSKSGVLLIARESGIVHRYEIPTLEYEVKYELISRPFKMELNCNATRLASIDFGGLLSMYDLNKSSSGEIDNCSHIENIEYKDVWNMKFAEDNPLLFAMIEKTKLRIIHNLESEEPIVFSGYICEFQDLEVTTILLDEIMQEDVELTPDYVVTIETKTLRDCRQLLDDNNFDKALELVENAPQKKLWKMLAEYCLEKLDLDKAEQAFIRYTYYPGIKLIKKLRKIQNNTLKMAEVSIYFGRYNEAEQRFSSIDRPDLIIQMLKSIGEWNRVLHLQKKNDSASDAEMSEAWNAIGNQHFDKHNWSQAVGYFTQGRCFEKLMQCYYYMEDYIGLEKLADLLPENSPLLFEIAEIFLHVGMCDKAVYAYMKNNEVKKAIDCCIQLNHWQTAIELARTKDMSDIGGLLSRYAKQLLSNKCYTQAVELYRRAGCFLEAAKIVQKMTEDEAKKSKNYLKLKKMSVIVGLLIEQHHEQNKMQAKARLKDSKGQEATSALDGMLQEEFVGISESKLLDRPWHWAEAYHYYLLAQRHLFDRYYDAAMKTAKLLMDYEDVLSPKNVYSLLAICAIHNRAFATCSRAFSKLETLDSFTKKEKENLTNLTFKIFTKYSPKDPDRVIEYDEMENYYDGDSKTPICIVSGQQITQVQFWMCPVCKHAALEDEINKLHNCPFCHSQL